MPFTQAFPFLHPDLSLPISPLLNHTDCVISHEVLFRPVTDNSGHCNTSPQFRHIRKYKWCTRAHLVGKEEAEFFNSKLHVLSFQQSDDKWEVPPGQDCPSSSLPDSWLPLLEPAFSLPQPFTVHSLHVIQQPSETVA